MIRNTPVEKYPDSQASRLRQELATKLGADIGNIMVGSGTTEIIRLIALTYLCQRDPVLILEPTYGEYEVASRIAGVYPMKYHALEKNGFIHDINDVVTVIKKRRPRAFFLCNPNNPTGKYLPRNDIERILESMNDNLLVLDEAYVAFVDECWCPFELIEKCNIIILRSMTKDFGLPGLRLGYAVARREIIDSLRLVLPPWNVNNIAQEIGIAVLKEEEYLRQSLIQVREAKHFLTTELAKLGFEILPSDTHYFLVKVRNAPTCRHSLLRNGIMVRDCSSFGLPEYIRVSPRSLQECEKLVDTMQLITKTKDSLLENLPD